MSNNNEAAEAEAKAASDAAEAASEAAREAHNATIRAEIKRLNTAIYDLSRVDIQTFNNLESAGDNVWAGNVYDNYKDAIQRVNKDIESFKQDVATAEGSYSAKIAELQGEIE